MLDKNEYKEINLKSNSLYVENNRGTIVYQTKPLLSKEDLLTNINEASVDLLNYDNKFNNEIHIKRAETSELFDWVKRRPIDNESNIALLIGNAGYGKSVVLKDLFDLLYKDNIPTLGIKADRILNINSLKEIEAELSLKDSIVSIFQKLNEDNQLAILLIDQIDALSQSLSSNRNAINSYDRLIKQLENYPNVKIIISCRTYDLDFDPILRSYKGKKIFRLSELEIAQVDDVLIKAGIVVNDNQMILKRFLRIPLHLKLFCKVGLDGQFDDSISLQKLYDAIWDEYILGKNSAKTIELLTLIADRMHSQQHIVVDKRKFDLHSTEVQFLLHHDLLRESTGNKIQFIHQTFFDYIYARTFIAAGNSIAEWLSPIHQGLFIRSQVKQIFAYLRDLDNITYINELKNVLLGKYRFHLKLLLINDLAFYQNPLSQEKRIISDLILTNQLYLQIFLESIQTPEWFKFIISKSEFTELLLKNNEETDRLIINLCTRIIWQDSGLVIDFLNKNQNSVKIIENVLIQIPEANIAMSYDLFNETHPKWSINIRQEYYYLKKNLKTNPEFVISHLKKDFDDNIKKIDWFNDKYIPGDSSGLEIYRELYKEFPNKAIPFFLYLIEEIVKSKEYESIYGIYTDAAFNLYRPNPSKTTDDFYDYKSLYNKVLGHIKNKLLDELSTSIIIANLDSKHANIIAIGVFYLLENKNSEINRIFDLFTKSEFFLHINSSEILKYYSKELLAETYSFLSPEQQKVVNESILATIKDFHYGSYKDLPYTENKVYSSYLKKTYSLLSMIPKSERNRYTEIKKVYHEGFRKYGLIKNEEPQRVTVHIGDKSYGNKSYQAMTIKQWYASFLKLNSDEHSFASWNSPSMGGNKKQFKSAVTKSPEKFYSFLLDILKDKDIRFDYILEGIVGLQEGYYENQKIEKLIIQLVNVRIKIKEQKDFELLQLLWIIKKLICDISNNNHVLDITIFTLIKTIALQHDDKKDTNRFEGQETDNPMDVVNAGTNSVRGVAVECLVSCYKMEIYKDEIFKTLENIADTANEITRSCIIFEGAYLNNLDRERAFNLYLRVVHDYDSRLLAIPADEGHPLRFHMYISFQRLIPFFEKAITIAVAGKAMSSFLLNAYINNIPKSYTLLKRLLDQNKKARENVLFIVSTKCLGKEELEKKGWKLLNYLLNLDDKDLGEQFNNCFIHIPAKLDSNLIVFLNKYVKSPLSRYTNNYYYDFLRKLISIDANQCLIWLFASKPEKVHMERFYNESPLNVLIESYNGIREYDNENPILEKTMDVFDSLLQITEYRNSHISKLLKELES